MKGSSSPGGLMGGRGGLMAKHFTQGHALIVGVGGAEDLPNTVDDAKGIADILKDPDAARTRKIRCNC
jgi:hypothetical protein